MPTTHSPYLESIQLVDNPSWGVPDRLYWEVKFSEDVRDVDLGDFIVPAGAQLRSGNGAEVNWSSTPSDTFFVSVNRHSPEYFYDESVLLRVPIRQQDVNVNWAPSLPNDLDGTSYPYIWKSVQFPYDEAGGVWFKFTNANYVTTPPVVPGLAWAPSPVSGDPETAIKYFYAYPSHSDGAQGSQPPLSEDLILTAVANEPTLASFQPAQATDAEIDSLNGSFFGPLSTSISFPYQGGGGLWVEVSVGQPIHSLGGLLNFSESIATSGTPTYAAPLFASYPTTFSSSASEGPFYVYLTRSTAPGDTSTAPLNPENIDWSLMPGGATIRSADGSRELDYGYDDIAIIKADTPNQASPGAGTANMIEPGGAAGFDTLDLRYHSSADRVKLLADYGYEIENLLVYNSTGSLTHSYSFANFDRYIVGGNVEFYGSDAQSEVVQVVYSPSAGSDNRIFFGHDGLQGTNKTDVVDYSLNSSMSISVDLSPNNNDGIVEVTFRDPGGTTNILGKDEIYSAEGIFGSQGADVIAGDVTENVLWGAGGDDRLTGDAGNDFLHGGAGQRDILEGGLGTDILIDFDGATLIGGDSGNSSSSRDKDLYVVQKGSTIENFYLAQDGAGLAGRANTSANDIVVFSLSMSALVGIISSELDFPLQIGPQTHLYDYVDSKSKLQIVRDSAAQDQDGSDWVVQWNFFYSNERPEDFITLASVRIDNVPMTGGNPSERKDLAVVEITDGIDFIQSSIDWMAVHEIPDEEFQALRVGGNFGVAFALEAVAAGTVRSANANGLMFGNNADSVRIFNPGEGSQRILGSEGEDRYQFLSQLYKVPATAHSMNSDKILDTGGEDSVEFADLSLDLEGPITDYSAIEALEFFAVKAGREIGSYSLKTNYTLDESNNGEFTWFGHFRRGFDMQLEEIVVGEEGHQTVLKMADVVYSGAIRTPTQIAPEGQDTIFVGGVGPDGGVSKFVINLDEETDVGDDLQQHLFFWEGKIGSMMELEIKTTLNDPISFTEIEGSSDRRSFMAQIDHDTNESTPDISIYLHLMAGLPRLFLDEFLVNQHG